MAGYRQFHTEFWKDEYIIELEPLEKLLYAYLFTNELSSISGLYKIPLRVVINETGLEKDFTQTALTKFESDRKIMYADGVMWVVNMQKYHKNASPLTMKKVKNDVDEIGDCLVKSVYLYYMQTGKYSIDTVSILIAQRKREREREIKKERESEPPPGDPSLVPPSPEPDFVSTPFTRMNALVSNKIHLTRENTNSTDKWDLAIDQLIADGVTEDDIDAAVAWLTKEGRTILGAQSIVRACAVEKSKRERGNGNKPATRFKKDPDGNLIEVEP